MKFIKEITLFAPSGTLKRFQGLETSFKVEQGKISALISVSELIELQNGNKTMYSRMASTEQTVKGLSQKYTDLNTKYDTVSGQYTDLDSNVADYKTAVDGFSANLTKLHTHIEKDYSTTKQMNLAIEAAVNGLTLEVRESSYGNYCTNSNFDSETFGWEYGGNKVPKYTYSDRTCTRLLDYVGNSLQGLFEETKFIRWIYTVNRKQKNEFIFQLAAKNAGTVKVYLDDIMILSVEKTDITEEWKEFSAEATVEQGEHTFKIQVEETNKIVYVTAAQILAKNTDWAESKLAVLSDSISAEVKRASDEEKELSSLITQTAESVSSKVSKGSVISEINQTAEKVKISAAKINFNGLVTANNYFQILTDGSFVAAYGTLGGWTVKDGIMKSNDQKIVLDPVNNKIYFDDGDDDFVTELSPDGTRTNFLTVDGGIVGGDAALLISAASSSRIQFYDSFSDDGEDMIKLQGNLEVRGTKSRVARTENFSDRLLYCYETPTPMFGDLGCGTTNDRGIAIVDIDPAFSETINSGIEYQVFLQKEGDGDIWVAKKDTEFFMVRGTPNLKFSWEVKCIQKSFEHLRLDEKEVQEAAQKDARDTQKDYNIIIDTVVEDYDKEMEELINESN